MDVKKNEIKCEKKLIKDIFTSFWFRVPNYQRPYVWDIDHVKTLFDDTFDAYIHNKDSQYFLGSLVLKINEQKDESGVPYVEYELLDGQQRLTTIFLFFAVLRDFTSDDSIKKSCVARIFQERNDLESIPERMRIVFDTRDEVKEFVDKYIKSVGATSNKENLLKFEKNAGNKYVNVSIKNMSKAIITIREFLKAHNAEIYDYFKFFIGKVLMTYVATEQLEDAFQLFTVLNNRGVKLTNGDILKAMNLKALNSDKLRNDWSIKWEEMEKYFGEDFDKFLSNVRTIIVKRKAVDNLLKEFEENIYASGVLSRGQATFDCIFNYFEIYKQVFDEDHYDKVNDYDVHNYLKFMSFGLGTDYWVAPVISYYSKFQESKFIEFIKLLDKKISADWIVSLSPTKRIDNVNKIIAQIEKCSTLSDIKASGVFDIDASEFERIMALDLYGKRYARYILLKLDLLYQSKSTKFNPQVTLSIEHILPQNPPNTPENLSQWRKDFTDAEREEWVDKMGNLILLSRKKNTSQGNRDFQTKKEKYFKSNVEVFPNSVRVFDKYSKWTLAELKENHEEVMKKLLAEYIN